MTKSISTPSTVQTVIKNIFGLLVLAIVVRMILGLVVLVLNITGIAITWLQDGAPLDWLTLRPRDFVIFVIVATILYLGHRRKNKQSNKEESPVTDANSSNVDSKPI